MSGTNDPSQDAAPDAGTLRFLRLLVTALTGTMILGLLAVVYLLVTRLPSASQGPVLPDAVVLPDGAQAEAVTFGKGWIAVVTDQQEILMLDATTGAIRQRVRISD